MTEVRTQPLFGHSTIYGVDGEHHTPYLTRIWIGRLRLHIFHRGDQDPDHHDHPWDFWTFPLTSYVEEVLNPDLAELIQAGSFSPLVPPDAPYVRRQVVPAFRLSFRPATYAHRVLGRYSGSYLYEDTKTGRFKLPQHDSRKIVTLVWSGRSGRRWGFLKHRDGRWCWTHWRDYVFAGGKHAACEAIEEQRHG